MTKLQMAQVIFNYHTARNAPLKMLTPADAIRILTSLSTAALQQRLARIPGYTN